VKGPTSHFDAFHRIYARLGPPLRPNEEVIAAYARELSGHAGCVLLLGVTPALANIGAEVYAADKNEMMVLRRWPGNTERRHACRADWRALPFPASRFTAAVGDGALNSLGSWRGFPALFSELERVLEPGAAVVTRVYARPAVCEPVAAVAAAAMAGEIPVFNAFKWRLAMALTAEAGSPDIEVAQIKLEFDRLFPDRTAIAMAARWEIEDIDTIDIYAGSRMIYNFPTLSEIEAAIPSSLAPMRVVSVGTYPLAERCPLIVLRKAEHE